MTTDSNHQLSNGAESTTLSCTIAQAKTATLGSCNSLTYSGSAQTLATGGSYVTYTNNSATNA